jgi:hypothetical protein
VIAGGVELLLSLHRRLTRDVTAAEFDASGLDFTLVTSGDEPLPAFPRACGGGSPGSCANVASAL